MAYVNLNFIPGEILTAAKMNLLVANDASFHDGTGIGDGSIQPQHIGWKDFIQSKQDNATLPVVPAIIQYGRARVRVPTDAVEATTSVTFPKEFENGMIPTVICTYNGYGDAGDPWSDTPNPSWAGAAIGAVSITNSSFTARCRRFDGTMLRGVYYFSWIAIGAA
jgi:hypothetical protein